MSVGQFRRGSTNRRTTTRQSSNRSLSMRLEGLVCHLRNGLHARSEESRPLRVNVSHKPCRGLSAIIHIEGATDLDRINLRLQAEIPRCALNLHMAQQRPNRLQVARPFQDVQSFRPAQRLQAIDGRIKTRFVDPVLYQAVQLPGPHRAVSSAAASEQVIAALLARRCDEIFECPHGNPGQSATHRRCFTRLRDLNNRAD